ncbi:SulP family inorganic anion transporter [Streptomyces sp. NPDC092296]|uniref:SulP family inorganic anion transporter n=1 Tax=Streptomyces sp. NPDC092296 TaxID=3366012 RepID=UPI0037F5A945
MARHPAFRPAFARQDLAASLVVFLVAVPLCIGVAVASGVPAELGLVTGIVGGLVVGPLPGSRLQVSGPAAGLAVLVHQAVTRFGLPALGVLVLGCGLLQLAMGALRLGRWFRAISVAVVQGMLAGIGLVLIAGQLYGLAGVPAPGGLGVLTGLPALVRRTLGTPSALVPVAMAAGTVLMLVLWQRLPARLRLVPAPLVAVVLASVVTAAVPLRLPTAGVHGLLGAVRPLWADGAGGAARLGMLGTVLAFALIASAESLFSAAAVDRLHDGPGTDYDRELMAQGIGNTVCGLLGALPMTAVIVRSSANVRAGARTRASRVLHGCWLLLFAALLPGVLGLIPLAALAGVLIHAGAKLVPVGPLAVLWREHRGEAAVLVATASAVMATDLLEGVLLGLLLAVVKCAWETSQLQVEVADEPGAAIRVTLSGSATFLRLPGMLATLERLPRDRPVTLDLAGLRYLDHACRTALQDWAARQNTQDVAALPAAPTTPVAPAAPVAQ